MNLQGKMWERNGTIVQMLDAHLIERGTYMKLHCTSADVMQRLQMEQEPSLIGDHTQAGARCGVCGASLTVFFFTLHQSACGNLNRNLCLIFIFIT